MIHVTAQANVIINEWSQGSSGGKEWVELLVTADTDLRGWTLQDTQGTGLGGIYVKFKPDPDTFWQSVPAGTLIVVYNANDKESLFPLDDLNLNDDNFTMVVPHNNSTFFDTAGTNQWLLFNNTILTDNPSIKDSSGTVIHDWDQNNDASFAVNPPRPGSNKAVHYTTNSVTGVTNATNYTQTAADIDNVTPAAPNGGLNTSLINFLRFPIISKNPSDYDIDIDKSSDIIVQFSDNIDIATVTNSSFNIEGSISGTHHADFSISTDTIIANPTNHFTAGEIITVTLTTEIKSTGGVPLVKLVTWSFKIKEEPQPQVPVTHHDVSTGLTPLPPTMNLQIQFGGNGTGTLTIQTGRNFPGTDHTLRICSHDEECDFPNLETASWVKITPQAAPGSRFHSWGGSVYCRDGNPFMINNINCIAYFSTIQTPHQPSTMTETGTSEGTVTNLNEENNKQPVIVSPVVVDEDSPIKRQDKDHDLEQIITDPVEQVLHFDDSVDTETSLVVDLPVVVDLSPTIPQVSELTVVESLPQSESSRSPFVPSLDKLPCPTARHLHLHLDEDCDADGQIIENLKIVRGGSLADAIITGTITNDEGLVSDLILESTAALVGGYVTHRILNKGFMGDFVFVGAEIQGGILGGNITIATQVLSEIREVTLAPGTVIQGKSGFVPGTQLGEKFIATKFAGKITGDVTDPAMLENVTIANDAELENIILGKDVVLGQNVKLNNVTCSHQRANGKGFDSKGLPFDDTQTCFTVQQNVVTLLLVPNSKLLGQIAEPFFILMQGQKAFVFIDQWQAWDGHLTTLQFNPSLTLSATQLFEFPDIDPFKGKVDLYVGLRLKDDDTLIYHQLQ